MTNEKILAVLAFYEAKLKHWATHDDGSRLLEAQLLHAQGMIPTMRQHLADNRRDKVFRWLGFMQGIFYCHGRFTIREMADHNRTTKKDFLEFNSEHHFQQWEPCRACRNWDGCSLWQDFAEAPDQ